MLIGIIIIVVLVVAYILAYNGLQGAKVHTDEAWSQISVQLKRRNDLIPNLVETTKGYAKHEKETLAQVIQLRNQLTAVPAGDHQEAMEVSNQLSSSLKSVFALAENYPDLKANTEFTKLMEELTNTENKIAYSRQLYNSCAANYNQKLVSFPTNMVGKVHGMQKVDYLEVPVQETKVPEVKF